MQEQGINNVNKTTDLIRLLKILLGTTDQYASLDIPGRAVERKERQDSFFRELMEQDTNKENSDKYKNILDHIKNNRQLKTPIKSITIKENKTGQSGQENQENAEPEIILTIERTYTRSRFIGDEEVALGQDEFGFSYSTLAKFARDCFKGMIFRVFNKPEAIKNETDFIFFSRPNLQLYRSPYQLVAEILGSTYIVDVLPAEEIKRKIYEWIKIYYYPLIGKRSPSLSLNSDENKILISAIKMLIDYLVTNHESLENNENEFNKLLYLVLYSQEKDKREGLLGEINDDPFKDSVIRDANSRLAEINILIRPYQGDDAHKNKFKEYFFRLFYCLESRLSQNKIKYAEITEIFKIILKCQANEESLIELDQYVRELKSQKLNNSLDPVKAIWQEERKNPKNFSSGDTIDTQLSIDLQMLWEKVTFDYFDAYLSNRNQKELKNFIDDFLRKNHSPVFVASEEIEQYIYSWLIKQYPLIENLFSFLEPESQQTVVSAINILINYLRSKEEPLENSDSQFNKLLFLIFHSRRATITDCNLLLEKIKDEALKALVLQKRKEALKEIMDTLTKPYQDGDEVHQKKFKSYLFQIINLLKVKFSKDGIKKDKIASIFEMLLKHQNQEESLVEINRYIENFIKLNIAPSKPIESIACLLEIKAIWQRESENRKKAIGANEKQSSPLSDETDPFWKKDGFKDFFDELLAAIKRKELKGLIDSFKTNEKSPDLPSPRLP